MGAGAQDSRVVAGIAIANLEDPAVTLRVRPTMAVPGFRVRRTNSDYALGRSVRGLVVLRGTYDSQGTPGRKSVEHPDRTSAARKHGNSNVLRTMARPKVWVFQIPTDVRLSSVV